MQWINCGILLRYQRLSEPRCWPYGGSVTGNRLLSHQSAIAKGCHRKNVRDPLLLSYIPEIHANDTYLIILSPTRATTYISIVNRITMIKISHVNITNNLSVTYYTYVNNDTASCAQEKMKVVKAKMVKMMNWHANYAMCNNRKLHLTTLAKFSG